MSIRNEAEIYTINTYPDHSVQSNNNLKP